MSGRELSTICLGRISFGSSTPTWKNSLASTSGPGRYSNAGWSGVPAKRLGCLTLSLNRGWDNLKIPKTFSIAIWKPTPLSKHISKWRSFNSEIKIKNLQEKFMNALSLNSDLMLSTNIISWTSRNFRLKCENTIEPDRSSNLDWSMSPKTRPLNSMSYISAFKRKGEVRRRSMKLCWAKGGLYTRSKSPRIH